MSIELTMLFHYQSQRIVDTDAADSLSTILGGITTPQDLV